MACSTLLSWAGVKAAWDSHSLATPPVPHTYSLHSWCGILTLAAALLQVRYCTFVRGLSSHKVSGILLMAEMLGGRSLWF